MNDVVLSFQIHKIFLVIEVLSKLSFFANIKDMLHVIFMYFCKLPKKHLMYDNLSKFLEERKIEYSKTSRQGGLACLS